jgi:hypothetical protein
LLENCVFYILRMYEFLHRVGQTRSFGDAGSMSGLPEGGHDWVASRYFGLSAELMNVRVLGPVPLTSITTGSFTSMKWATFAGSV